VGNEGAARGICHRRDVVIAMDRDEREEMIADLERKRADNLAAIEERRRAFEADIFAQHDALMAECAADQGNRVNSTQLNSADKSTAHEDLIYKEYLPAVPPVDELKWVEGWEKWMAGHLANERAVTYAAVNKLLDALQLDLVDAFGKLRAETKAQFDAQIEKANALSDVRKQLSTERGERERLKHETDLASRDARIATLERQVEMLCRFLSFAGYKLPEGL
jgi:hypothetical protein